MANKWTKEDQARLKALCESLNTTVVSRKGAAKVCTLNSSVERFFATINTRMSSMEETR